MMEVFVDHLLCDGCGECVQQCSMGVFELKHRKAHPTHAHICIGCFKCQELCPRKAIAPRWIMRVS